MVSKFSMKVLVCQKYQESLSLPSSLLRFGCMIMPPELKSLSALFMKVDRHKYLVTSKCLFENILLEDTIIQSNYYLVTRYSYWVREVSYYKILLLFSVSNYYLQDKKIRYCPSLPTRSCLLSLLVLFLCKFCAFTNDVNYSFFFLSTHTTEAIFLGFIYSCLDVICTDTLILCSSNQ